MKTYTETRTEIIEANDGCTMEELYDDAYQQGCTNTFAEMEKNRLRYCENMTEEEAEREMDFVSKFIKENKRIPTFSDCIERTRKEMIEKSCKWLKRNTPIGLMEEELSDFFEDFKIAMEDKI